MVQRLFIELPADQVSVGLGYFAARLRQELAADDVGRCVWIDFGEVDPQQPQVAELLASWDQFAARLRDRCGLSVGRFRLVGNGHPARAVVMDEPQAAADVEDPADGVADEPETADQGAVDVPVVLPADPAEQQRIAAMMADPVAANRSAMREQRQQAVAAGRATVEQMQEIYQLSERLGMRQAVVDEQIVAQQRLRRIEDLTTQAAAGILRKLRAKVSGGA